LSLPPLSLYVHLPWCVRKCPYCDFNSHALNRELPRDRYIAALLVDLDKEAERAAGRSLLSIFLGGGTPSLFPPADIARLLDAIGARFRLSEDVEITMEANPGTVESGDPRGYRDAGVNRLSIGAQSFASSALQTLGRIHSVADIERTATAALTAGFAAVNLDIMYGLPGQSLAAALADLEAATALGVEHLSWYQLTLEANTVFFSRPPPDMPDDELAAEMQVAGQAVLAAQGYEQYEVSAYARAGQQCRHNLNYWRFGDYLAAGAGAHGKITDARGVWRYRKPANPLSYMQALEAGAPETSLEPVPAQELVFEFMLNALRLSSGFSLALFGAHTGLPSAALLPQLQEARARGLIEELSGDVWRPSELGQRFLNDLQAQFLPA